MMFWSKPGAALKNTSTTSDFDNAIIDHPEVRAVATIDHPYTNDDDDLHPKGETAQLILDNSSYIM